MTISTQNRTAGPFSGNGVTTVFPFNFKVFSSNDLLVVRTDTAASASADLKLTQDYTVTLNGDQEANPGGTVKLLEALPAGSALVLTSQVEYLQPLDLTNQGGFYPKVINAAFDRVTILLQQLRSITSRSLRFPVADTGTNTELPQRTTRANKLLGFDTDGNPVAVAPLAQSATALQAQLGTESGTGLIGWVRGSAGAVATTLSKLLGWQEVSPFEFMTAAQISDYKAGTQLLDLSESLQAWLNAAVSSGLVASLPKGNARHNTTLQVNGACVIRGHGINSSLTAWGCNGISLNADHIATEDFSMFSATASGSSDPRLFIALVGSGTGSANRTYLRHKNVYLQGWSCAISWRYTWQSRADGVITVNTNVGIDLFGQSVNNHIMNCDLVVNGGLASIQTRKDGSTQGEGLYVSNTLMASGKNAILSDGFLSIGVDVSCMADLIQGKAFDLTGVSVFKCDAQWVYSTDSCFYAGNLATPSPSDWNINVGRATCTGSATLMYWGSNNNGLKLGGTVYLPYGTGYPVSLNGSQADIYCNVVNGTPNAGVRVGNTGNTVRTIGDSSVEWAVSPIAQVGNAPVLTLPRNGCNSFTVVGQTNIASIATAGWAGQEVTLTFQVPLTVTNGANLKLAGGANFIATADDVLKLMCDGTTWRESGRSIN